MTYTEEDLKLIGEEIDQIHYCEAKVAKQLIAEILRLRGALEDISDSWMCYKRKDKRGQYTMPPMCQEIADAALKGAGNI